MVACNVLFFVWRVVGVFGNYSQMYGEFLLAAQQKHCEIGFKRDDFTLCCML
jgi:hypothetical protein